MKDAQEIKEKTMNPILYLFVQAWRYATNDKKMLIKIWTMFLVAGILNLYVSPIAWAKITDLIQSQGITKDNLRWLLVLLGVMLMSTVIFWALHGPARVFECVVAFNIRANYRKYFLDGVMNLPMQWHNQNHSGDTIDKVDKGTRALFDFSESSFEIIYTIIKLVGSYMVLLYFFPMASIGVFVMMCITFWVTSRFDKILMKQYSKLNSAENEVTESTFDTISNITTVIILRVEELVFKAIMSKVKEPASLFRKNSALNEWKWFINSVLCTITVVLVMAVYFWIHAYGNKTVMLGDVYLLYRYLGNISEVFSRFAWMYGAIMKWRSQLANAQKVSSCFTDQSFSGHQMPSNWQVMSIKNLDFSYHQDGNGSNQPRHLSDVNLEIRRGQKIAFVGESGSGKTTMLKLMRALYNPDKLELKIDGALIPSGFDGIAHAISLIPQMPEIFSSTIRYNITIGANHDPETIDWAIDNAEFARVLDNLPNGLESRINERGVNLSGGQQQRLALARGLLASLDKQVVLLDEPTSNLDTSTEFRVYQRIFQAFSGRTIISSIHRLHLLPQFDQICLFDEGQIVATGTLHELITGCPLFKKLWDQYQGSSQS